MNRRLRDAGRGICTLLAATTLIVQSVLPVYADTADTKKETSGAGYTISEETGFYTLEYFDRIAVNSVSGLLTIKPGEDFSISFPRGWEQYPSFSVQDEILVVSGRKSGERTEKSSDGTVVVIGEDEPGTGGTDSSAEAAQTAQAENAERENGAQETVPEIVITVPSGVGLDTLRIAMETGDLIITDVTANSVTIQSGGGSMVMKDVSLGTVDIYAEAGSVSMSECTFNSLNIGMAEGDVTVGAGNSLARCRMELKTDDGNITYNGNAKGSQFMQPGNGKRFLQIQVGSGDISVSG